MKKLFAAFILCAFTSLGLSARTQNDRPVTLKGHAVTAAREAAAEAAEAGESR